MISRVCGFLVCLGFLTGCGGSGAGGTAPVVKTIYGPNTIVLTQSDSRQVQSSTDSTVTISGDTSAIRTGSVIASSQGAGLLRTVTGVVSSGATTTFATKQASIEDAVQTASIRDQRTLGSASVASFVPGGTGVSLGGGGKAPQSVGGSINLTFTDYQLALGTETSSGAVTLSGSLGLSVDLKTALDVGFFKIKRFSCDAAVTASASVTITSTLTQKIEKKVLLGTLTCLPFELAPGVEATPVLKLYGVISGSVANGFTFTTVATVTGEAGVTYQNGSWSTNHSVSHSFSIKPDLSLYTSLSVGLTPVRCELTLVIDDVAGPYIQTDAPTFDGTLTLEASPAGLDLSVSTTFDAQIGAHVSILSHNLLDASFSFPLEPDRVIYDQFFPSNGTGTVGIK